MIIHNIVVSKILPNMAKYAKYGIWGAYAGAPNMVKWGVPGKILQNAVVKLKMGDITSFMGL